MKFSRNVRSLTLSFGVNKGEKLQKLLRATSNLSRTYGLLLGDYLWLKIFERVKQMAGGGKVCL